MTVGCEDPRLGDSGSGGLKSKIKSVANAEASCCCFINLVHSSSVRALHRVWLHGRGMFMIRSSSRGSYYGDCFPDSRWRLQKKFTIWTKKMVRLAVSVIIHLFHGDLPGDFIPARLSKNTRWSGLRISGYDMEKHCVICEVAMI